MWKTIRRILALFCLIGFVLVFCDHSEGSVWAKEWAWLAKIQFVPALLAGSAGVLIAILALTLVYGRIYCSTLCPLGLLQDLLLSFRKKNRYRFLQAVSWFRFLLLIVFALGLLAGLPYLFPFLEPYSIFGRITSEIAQPITVLMNNAADWAAQQIDSTLVAPKPLFMHGMASLITALVCFLLLLFFCLRYGRLWCGLICPLGTFLGFLAKYALFRPRIQADLCTHCGQCEHHCKANCIDSKQAVIDTSRCIACFNCQDVCQANALTFNKPQADTSNRRQALEKIGGAVAFLALPQAVQAASAKSEAELLNRTYKERRPQTIPVLPPGAMNQRHFTTHCTGCQLCVAQCPGHVLRSKDEGEGLLQPSLGFEHGFCDPSCVLCSTVCPTAAITPISKGEKTVLQIGRATVAYERCIVTTDKVPCTMCQRACPTTAISLVGDQEHKLPAVNAEKCIGCGACEFYCPARPVAAITVEGVWEQRKLI